jgi:putative phage-type endonuclease
VIAGMNQYKSPFALYLEKIGELQDDEQSEAAYWGNTLEEVVAAEFSKRTGLDIRERHELLQHDTYEFMLANLDREVICPERGIGILECKTASEYLKDEWVGENIPDSYYLQVQHYLAVTGYSFAYIAVLIGGNKFVYKEVIRDDEVIEFLYKLESDFWNNHVIPKIPPPVDGSDSCKDSLNKLYKNSIDEMIEFSPDEMKLVEELRMVKSEIKLLEKRKDELENNIKFLLGDKQIGTYDGIEIVTWKPNKNGRRTLKLINREVVKNG